MNITIPKFSTKKELFAYLAKNKSDLFELKKAQFKKTNEFGTDPLQKHFSEKANKALTTSFTDDVASGVIKRSLVCNTYNWMDSHDDVHLDGLFAKSIADRQDKIFHLHDHEQKVTAKVGIPVSIYEKSMEWSDVGVSCGGNTMGLFMDSNIMKEYNAMVFLDYLNKRINQHSVAMVYVKLDLAVNDPDYKEEYFVFSKNISRIGNKEKALEQGYFWAVSEAKLIENSAVLAGSNELTPTVENEEKKKTEEVPAKKNFYQLLFDGIKDSTPKEKTFLDDL